MMERSNFDPDELGSRKFYKLLTAVVVPRPIAWVSTTSDQGVDNLAPHSFFTVSSVSPPVVQFTSVGRKDSLRNIEQTGEFVVNVAHSAQFEHVNASATDFPADVAEFDAVGVEREPSLTVAPPRVADAPVALECRFHSSLSFGDSVVVFGRVVHAAIAQDVLVDGHPSIELLKPLARLGRNEWSEIGEIRTIERVPYESTRPDLGT